MDVITQPCPKSIAGHFKNIGLGWIITSHKISKCNYLSMSLFMITKDNYRHGLPPGKFIWFISGWLLVKCVLFHRVSNMAYDFQLHALFSQMTLNQALFIKFLKPKYIKKLMQLVSLSTVSITMALDMIYMYVVCFHGHVEALSFHTKATFCQIYSSQ